MDWIRKALFLGFVFFLAVFCIKPIGVSTQYSVLSGIVYHALDKDLIWEDEGKEYGYSSKNAYFDKSDGKLASHIMNPWNYDFIFVLAIPLGAWIAYMFTSKRKIMNGKKEECNHPNKMKDFIPSFVSGFLLLYGARLADGCTSGHMMSGMMQGSISGYVFAASAFLVAIPTALIVKKYGRERED